MSKFRFIALQELSSRKPLEVVAPSTNIADYYGCHVFNKKNMQKYLTDETIDALKRAVDEGKAITQQEADLIANGMKSWAKDNGVTHYLTGFNL